MRSSSLIKSSLMLVALSLSAGSLWAASEESGSNGGSFPVDKSKQYLGAIVRTQVDAQGNRIAGTSEVRLLSDASAIPASQDKLPDAWDRAEDTRKPIDPDSVDAGEVQDKSTYSIWGFGWRTPYTNPYFYRPLYTYPTTYYYPSTYYYPTYYYNPPVVYGPTYRYWYFRW